MVLSYPTSFRDWRGGVWPARRSKFLEEMLGALEAGCGIGGVVELRAGAGG